MRRAALAVLALLLLAGCGSEPEPAPVSLLPPPTTSATAATSGPTHNARGNIVKEIGEPGSLIDGYGNQILEFRVDAIRQGEPCRADGYTEEPENGQFIAVDVVAQTTSDFDPASNDTEFLVAGYSWMVITADGVRHTVDTGSAWVCSPSNRDNLGGLTPAITVSGTVYLDAPADLIGAVITLTNMTIDGGWEWEVPAA